MTKKLTIDEKDLWQLKNEIKRLFREYERLQAYHAKITGSRHVWFGGGA